MSDIAKTVSHSGRELIAFRIGEQEFTVNVMNVREIRGWTRATPMPHSPSHMLGVINLRGVVLPIIDLSARLGMKPAEPSPRHVIIVTQVRDKLVGLLVDAVSDILTVTEEIIQPTPEVASDHERSIARGILAIDNRMICLMELEAIFPDIESEAA